MQNEKSMSGEQTGKILKPASLLCTAATRAKPSNYGRDGAEFQL